MTIYLEVPFRAKDEAKALGARWDAVARKWYVPAGRDPSLFEAWLPQLAPTVATGSTTPAVGEEPGVRLSVLLAAVTQVVSERFSGGVWTQVEVLELRIRQGHVYLEVSERSMEGTVLAKANAVIWAELARRLLPDFEAATGANLAPGIKLLVRAKPVFKAQYGFSLEIDGIDPNYTLGDLEARKREIRQRLKREGLFDLNRQLSSPWDFYHVLVVAPQGAAGLGDFQAEADRLANAGICTFEYVTCRFQGEGAAAEIERTLADVLCRLQENPRVVPDCVVIIRGGGAVNDLAWLNDFELAKRVCELPVPVFTGIGHERDSCILDEVAHTAFDTPSKVILGIERLIYSRVEAIKILFSQVSLAAVRQLQSLKSQTLAYRSTVLERAEQMVVYARQRLEERRASVAENARQQLAQANVAATALMREIVGQGPEKTLRRGFVMVRDEAGGTVTRAAQVTVDSALQVRFLDGVVQAQVIGKVEECDG